MILNILSVCKAQNLSTCVDPLSPSVFDEAREELLDTYIRQGNRSASLLLPWQPRPGTHIFDLHRQRLVALIPSIVLSYRPILKAFVKAMN